MDNQHNPFVHWAYFCHGKQGMDELRESLLLTALELENTKIKAQEELKMRDDELEQLKHLLNTAIKERDEANEKCQRLVFEKFLLQQHQSRSASGVSSINEDEPRREINSSKSSSDCDESIVSSPLVDHANPLLPPPLVPPQPGIIHGSTKPSRGLETFPLEQQLSLPVLLPTKPLPEKGKLLQAVMKAGPLLQTLLLAGPLPQWRHPPPPFDTQQIPPPPVTISSPPPPPEIFPIPCLHEDSLLNFATCGNNINSCGAFHRKRGFDNESNSTYQAKFQRVVLQ